MDHKLNLGAANQQGDYLHRGEHGMFEAVGFKLFNLAGIKAPWTHWAQLRNYFFYLHPETGLWPVHPWDPDLTRANNMFGHGNSPYKNRILPKPAFNREYGNRLREIGDLLFNTDQAYQRIGEHAAIIRDPREGPSMVDVDRAMWDYNPVMASGYVNHSKAEVQVSPVVLPDRRISHANRPIELFCRGARN